MKRLFSTLVAAALAAAIWAGAGTGSPRQPQTIGCQGGLNLRVFMPAQGEHLSWGAIQVVGDGHLIVIGRQLTVLDYRTEMMWSLEGFSAKGNLHPFQTEPEISCGFVTDGTLGDFVSPEEIGYANANDPAELALEVVVIRK